MSSWALNVSEIKHSSLNSKVFRVPFKPKILRLCYPLEKHANYLQDHNSVNTGDSRPLMKITMQSGESEVIKNSFPTLHFREQKNMVIS